MDGCIILDDIRWMDGCIILDDIRWMDSRLIKIKDIILI